MISKMRMFLRGVPEVWRRVRGLLQPNQPVDATGRSSVVHNVVIGDYRDNTNRPHLLKANGAAFVALPWWSAFKV